MRRSLFLSVATLMAITAGAQGLEYAYDNATMTAKVTYRMKQLGDGTWERIKGGYHGDIVIGIRLYCYWRWRAGFRPML